MLRTRIDNHEQCFICPDIIDKLFITAALIKFDNCVHQNYAKIQIKMSISEAFQKEELCRHSTRHQVLSARPLSHIIESTVNKLQIIISKK